MGVYVKGMKMPSQCYDCYIVANDYDKGSLYCKALDEDVEDWNSRLPNCPLVEVAEPHGRLIDEDELGELIHRMWVAKQLTNTKYNTFNDLLDIAKPVIEAEGE